MPGVRAHSSFTPTIGELAAGRDNNFDVLRFLMAVLVIWSHCFPLTLGEADKHEPLYRWTQGRATFGSIAVDVFFIISGFLVTMSWERTAQVWPYLKKRASRIYPGYIAATLICAFVVAPLFVRGDLPWMNRDYAARLLKVIPHLQEYKIDGVFADNPYPGSMYGVVWTIKYEFLCYLLVLLLGLAGLLRRRYVVLSLFIVSLTVYTAGIRLSYPHAVQRIISNPGPWPQLLTFYLSGMVFYLYRDRIPLRNWLAAASTAAIAVALVYLPALPVALATAGAYLVFWAAFQKHVALPRFAWHGDFSYGIYLYGYPVQQILVATWASRLTPLQLFAMATPLTVAAGALSWHGVEKWFLRRKTCRLNKGEVIDRL